MTDNLELENAKLRLKVQALSERLAEAEDKNADLRVDLTILSQQNHALQEELKDREPREVVEGEVVDG